MSNPATDPQPVEPLAEGQRLSPHLFDLRYEASPHIRRAELIRGVVHVASPLSNDHERFAVLLHLWLGTYALRVPGVEATGSPTIHLTNGARVEPDGGLRRTGPGASSHVVGQGESSRIHGAPELLAEVSLSTLEIDLDDVDGKRADYRESGVLEYLVVAPETGEVHWWALDQDGVYRPLPVVDGIVESRTFEGLRLDVAALLARDGRAVIDALG